MKNQALNVVILFIIFSISSCKKDDCKQTYNYKKYIPIYKPFEELHAEVKFESPKSLTKTGKIYLKGKYIFINEIDKGIHVIDNTQAESPQNIGFINIPGNRDISAIGNMLYADCYTDLLAIDISNLSLLKISNTARNVFPQRGRDEGISIDNTMGVVVGFRDTMISIDMPCETQMKHGIGRGTFENGTVFQNGSFTSSPTTVQNQPGIGGSMARFTISKNTLYAVDNSTLHTFNIQGGLQSLNSIKLGRNIETIFPYGDHLFIGSSNAMYIYSIMSPTAPTHVSTYIHGTACDPVIVDGNYAYITLRSGTPCNTTLNHLEVVNIENINAPSRVQILPLHNPHGLGKDGNKLFICDGNDGLKVFEASNPRQIPALPFAHFKNIQATDVIPFQSKLLMIGTDGLYQYEYSTSNEIKLLSKIQVKR